MKIRLYFYFFFITLYSSRNFVEYTLLNQVTKEFNDHMEKFSQDPYENWSFYKDVSKKIILKI